MKLLSFLLLITFSYSIQAQNTIQASEIIAKLDAGEDVSLANATITGKLNFTQLANQQLDPEKDWGSNKGYRSYVRNKITFENCTFTDKVLGYYKKKPDNYNQPIYNADFLEAVTFKNCRFKQQVNFKYSNFEDGANFSGSIFQEEVGFKYTDFAEATDFSAVEFGGSANFKYTKFPEGVSFAAAKFGREVVFKYTKFPEGVDFSATKFNRGVDFKYTKFYSPTDFTNADFNGSISMKSATINGRRMSSRPSEKY
ncbi:MAG: pentapeptide repeat-containing protein [Bacteroidota bacterium]